MPKTTDNPDNIQRGTPIDPRPQAINKIRIQIPSNASPSSIYSSSSESPSPHRIKKHKKRICVKCDVRFKHKTDWLKHIREHIDQHYPKVVLERLAVDDSNQNTTQVESVTNIDETNGLKIRLKLSRTTTHSTMTHCTNVDSTPRAENETSSSGDNRSNADSGEPSAKMARSDGTSTVPNSSNGNNGQARIRVLKVEEIKQSPPRAFSTTPDLQTVPMVSIPGNDDYNPFECPTFDTFSSIDNDTDDTTAELLKHLLESTNPSDEPIDIPSKEFITLDELAVVCSTCREKFPDIKFLESHQIATGHGMNNGPPLPPPLFEPIQQMRIGLHPSQMTTHQPIHPQHNAQHNAQHNSQTTNHLQQILSQPMKAMNPRMSMYTAPPNVTVGRPPFPANSVGNHTQPMQRMPSEQTQYLPRLIHPAQAQYNNHAGHPGHPAHSSQHGHPGHHTSQSGHPAHTGHSNHPPVHPGHLGHPGQHLGQHPGQHSHTVHHPLSGYPSLPGRIGAPDNTKHHNHYMTHPSHMNPPLHPNHPNPLGHPIHSMQRSHPNTMHPDNTRNATNMNPYMNMSQAQMCNQTNGTSMNSRSSQPVPATPQYGGHNFPMDIQAKPPAPPPPYQSRTMPQPNANATIMQSQTLPPPAPPTGQLRIPTSIQSSAFPAQARRSIDGDRFPIIANAPRTKGLPVIESVQSGSITLNKTINSDVSNRKRTASMRHSIDIVQPGTSQSLSLSTPSSPAPPTGTIMTTKETVTSILSNPQLTVRSTTSSILSEAKAKAKAISDLKRTPYSSAEEAVQKLQQNHSVSIIPKRNPSTSSAATPSTTDTGSTAQIDLSNEDENVEIVEPSPNKKKNSQDDVKCPLKKCKRRFATGEQLRRHIRSAHQSKKRIYRCPQCSARFISQEAIRSHIKNGHPATAQPKTSGNFGLPVVDFNDSKARQSMLSLGFSRFIPIVDAGTSDTRLFGLPILDINTSSVNIVKTIFGSDSTRLIKIDSLQSITKKDATKPQQQLPTVPEACTRSTGNNTDGDGSTSLKGLLQRALETKVRPERKD